MFEANWVFGLASLCLILAAYLLIADANRRQRRQLGVRHLQEVLARQDDRLLAGELPAEVDWLPPYFDRLLQRAGLEGSARLYWMMITPGVILFMIAEVLLGIYYALFVLCVVYPALLLLFLEFRIRRYRAQLVEQLPAFLESVSRILSVGCSLELAFRNATEECEEPLRSIFQQVVARTRMGQSLEEAMMQVADIYAVQELGYVASVFQLGMRYGGSAHTVLERLSTTMRERLRSQQELKAMTGETRASAWILSALPIIVGLLVLSSNPDYLLGMWTDASGRKLLLAAFGLQLVGMALLFRMSRID